MGARSKRGGLAHVAVVAVLLVSTLASPRAAFADEVTEARHREVGIGLASVLANVIYVPAKLAYAVVGGLTGGAAWALTGGNTQVARGVWVASFGGDYILAREMVAGDRKFHFSGPTESGL